MAMAIKSTDAIEKGECKVISFKNNKRIKYNIERKKKSYKIRNIKLSIGIACIGLSITLIVFGLIRCIGLGYV